jgi:alanine-synthesizing transaminase
MCEAMTPGPRLLMLNYPHNPTGIVASRDFFVQVVELAERYGFMVVNDFAYARITFDGYVAPSFLEVPGAMDVGVEFGSFSKSYNMAGWRVGYCVGNPEIIEGLGKIKGYYDYGIFSPIQIAGIMAMRDCGEDIAAQVQLYENRRDVMHPSSVIRHRSSVICLRSIFGRNRRTRCRNALSARSPLSRP